MRVKKLPDHSVANDPVDNTENTPVPQSKVNMSDTVKDDEASILFLAATASAGKSLGDDGPAVSGALIALIRRLMIMLIFAAAFVLPHGVSNAGGKVPTHIAFSLNSWTEPPVVHGDTISFDVYVETPDCWTDECLYGNTGEGTITIRDMTTERDVWSWQAGSAYFGIGTQADGTGFHVFKAFYTGGPTTFPSESAPITVDIVKNSPWIQTRSLPNPSEAGQPIKLKTSIYGVWSGVTPPTGTLAYTEGEVILGVATVNGLTSSITIAPLDPGSHSIVATYSGDANHESATTTFTHEVDGTATTTSLVTSPDPSWFGQTVSLRATVTPIEGSAGTPEGNVVFTIDDTTELPAALVGGVATATTAVIPAGIHSVTAAYGGSPIHAPSTSVVVMQTVYQTPTATTLTVTPNPSVFGEALTIRASVSPTGRGGGTPEGTVTFKIDGTTLGSATLSGGTATLKTTSPIPIGTHSIVAAYGGSDDHASSISPRVGQTIVPATTSLSLIATPNPSHFGQAVRFSVTVRENGDGIGTPGGIVTFKRNGVLLGRARLDRGTASLTTTSLPVGRYPITAFYSGDESHVASASTAVTQTVRTVMTTTSASADISGILPGGTVTLSATVAATSPTASTPTGNVVFKTGATVLGTVALSGGNATLATRALTTGSHSIVATYAPPAGFAASSSTGVAVTVDPRVGSEFPVNTMTTGSQQTPTLAILKSGGFVAGWASKDQDGSSWGVYAQRFLANGTPDGAEFRVNETTVGSQSSPAVAATADGGFTIAWVGTNTTGTSAGVWAQRFDATGTPLGTQFRVDTTKGRFQSAPTITAARPSGFAVGWVGSDVAGTSYRTYVQLYAQTGARVGTERVVSKTVMKRLISPPSIAPITGGFAVVWPSAAAATGNPIVAGQRLTSAGALSGTEFAITSASFAQQDPVVTGTADGGFAVAWTSLKQDGSGAGVFAQIYKATGVKTGATFRANTTVAADQAEPAISARPGGGFTIAWTSTSQDGSGKGVYAKRYSPTGAALDVEFRLNTTTAGNQLQPALAIANGNDFVATWTSAGQDGSLEGVYGQRYSVISP